MHIAVCPIATYRRGLFLSRKAGIDRKALEGKTIYVKNAQTDKDFQYMDKARSGGDKVRISGTSRGCDKKVIGVLRVYIQGQRV